MSEPLGFLPDYSGDPAKLIDEDVRRFVEIAMERKEVVAREILSGLPIRFLGRHISYWVELQRRAIEGGWEPEVR